MSTSTVGIDLGSQKTVAVGDDAELILTDTGSINRPTIISFVGKSRLIGEQAAAQMSGDNTITMLNLLAGKLSDEQAADITAHRRLKPVASPDTNLLDFNVNYSDVDELFSSTSLLGMFLAQLFTRIEAVRGVGVKIAFSLPYQHTSSQARALAEACQIAGIDLGRVQFTDCSDCLVATYARKLQVLRPPERASLEGKWAVIIEMGHTQSKAVVCNIGTLDTTVAGGAPSVSRLSVSGDNNLGAFHFDAQLFKHFASIVAKKHGTEIVAGTKKGQRLLLGCERLRKLLSQLPEASVTVENMTDAGDIQLSLRREDMNDICSELIGRFQALIRSALANASAAAAEAAQVVAAVEVVGGGARMPCIQQAIQSSFATPLPLGAKLDDASVALGAALVSNQKTAEALATLLGDAAAAAAVGVVTSVKIGGDVWTRDASSSLEAEGSVGLGAVGVQRAREREEQMQILDRELIALHAARNEIESYLLEMRSAKRRKFGEKIDGPRLDAVLDETEDWLWNNADASLAQLQEKDTTLRASVSAICADYLQATEEERVRVEQALEAESARAEAERLAGGEDEDDEDSRDNRKLRKPERMRMVVKNKEEGTELFKGGNFRPAAARYHKSLSHIAKFFDLSAEDEVEVKALRVTLYLNLASCYTKLENWDQVLRYCNDALAIDPRSTKALFRRSVYYEHKKDWAKAQTDLKACQEYSDVEDKLVTKAQDRVKKEIAKEKEKEKKMWGKAFA